MLEAEEKTNSMLQKKTAVIHRGVLSWQIGPFRLVLNKGEHCDRQLFSDLKTGEIVLHLKHLISIAFYKTSDGEGWRDIPALLPYSCGLKLFSDWIIERKSSTWVSSCNYEQHHNPLYFTGIRHFTYKSLGNGSWFEFEKGMARGVEVEEKGERLYFAPAFPR